jgi:glycogen debranching enzyme
VSLRPLLHDLVATVCAPRSVLSGPDGQIRRSGVQGMFQADRRILSEAVLRLDGREPEAVGHTSTGSRTVFVSVARWLGDPIADPTVRIERDRHVVPDGAMIEEIRIISTADRPVRTTVTLDLAVDLAAIETVRSGRAGEPITPQRTAHGLTWTRDGVTVAAEPEGRTGEFRWVVELPPRGRAGFHWQIGADDPAAVVHGPRRHLPWPTATVRADDRRIDRLVERSQNDLRKLRLIDGDDVYLAAGVPWFLTLFGRDSIWAARMLLPLGTDLAAGTLRTLARRQGARLDPDTGEAPGKILHELRRDEFVLDDGLRLPATYYGTIDATLLWVSLLHDAWRWGHPVGEIAALVPHLEAALGWLADDADPDGDGFLEYIDTSGRGLANQGWKDSGDAVRFHDGRLAEPPIALAEVQGYAYRAAMDGAALLDAFDRPGGEAWRAYAAGLADRFRARYWVPAGHPALALDRDKQPVDSLTSNIGHLLGTGLLSADEEAAVAGALAGETMSGGYGLRTMSSADVGFGPMSYHCGSVWTHDSAIVAAGLARAGHGDVAAGLIDGLLAAGEAFDYRLPELHTGFDRTFGRPMPYPAACRPQAWSAASAILLLQAALGLEPDVPGGVVRLRPLDGEPLGAIRAGGLRIAGHEIEVTSAGRITGLPPELTVR